MARQIHNASERRESPFLGCDCRVADDAAIRNVFEAAGRLAPGGCTIFLDRVEMLSGSAQKALALCIDTCGESLPHIIASATSDLEMELRMGRFREDLFYKLCGVCVPIPPLRYRKDEIGMLADLFLEKYSQQFGRPKPEVNSQLERFLQSQPWTGNLRELEDAMRTIVAVGNVGVAIAALQTVLSSTNRERSSANVAPVSLKQVARAASHRAERDLILKVLSRTKWNRKKAAVELRISYKALLYKLKEIGADTSIGTPKGSN